MRRVYLLIFQVFLCCAFAQASSDSLLVKRLESVAKDIVSKHIFDKRTAIFSLTNDSLGNYSLETTIKSAADDFVHRISLENSKISVSINLLPDSSLGQYTFGLINVSVGNIRTEPKNAAEMASQSLLGWQVDVLKKQGGYYLIRTPDAYISWIDASAISLKNVDDIANWENSSRLICIQDYGHVYIQADKQSQRVSDLVMGNILKYKGERKDFYQVVFPDGREGFVEKELMQDYSSWKKRTVASASSILRVAKTMIGVPYLWGGTSIKGVDCSGFTKIAYFMNGLVIPRDASQQVLVGAPIDILSNDELDTAKALKNLQPGDLLFFAGGTHRKPDARVTHVALYIGDGQFIHSAGKVRINSMLDSATNYDDFQSRTVVAARRYLGHIGSEGIKKVN